MGLFNRHHQQPGSLKPIRDESEDTITATDDQTFYSRPTFLRLFVALTYLISLVFIILVEIGNINNKAVIRNTYFLRIDLANVVPETVPNAALINTIAQSLGLHDFYQVGLWGYCAGYKNQGVTFCSRPKTLYWFNPVSIIASELLAGATIALPTDVVDTLDIVKVASEWMFGCFLIGAIFTFISIWIAPTGFSKKPRWSHKARRLFLRQLPVTVVTLIALLFTAAAAVIATVMFVIFRNTFAGAADLNIEASLGVEMLAFEWIAVALNLLGFLMQMGTCCGVCCCTGKRKAMRRQEKRISAREPIEEK